MPNTSKIIKDIESELREKDPDEPVDLWLKRMHDKVCDCGWYDHLNSKG